MILLWGDAILEDVAGLDILGVRRIDQAIEGALVNGITTISNRLRYISIMTWAIGAFFENELAVGSDGASFDQEKEKALHRFVRRVEFLVLAATSVDSGADQSGAIGARNHGLKMAALKAGNSQPFPDIPGEEMVGTYFGPASALGLVAGSSAAMSVPYFLTPRGTKIYQARRNALSGSPVLDALWNAESVDPDIARAAIPGFSLGAVTGVPDEPRLMKEALLQSWQPKGKMAQARVEKAYQQFGDTISWVCRQVASESLRPADVIARNYKAVSLGQAEEAIALKWAEFEWRRRCHYALELLISAVTVSLRDLREAPLEEVVGTWRDETANEKSLLDLWQLPTEIWDRTVGEIADTVPQDLLLGTAVSTDRFKPLEPGKKALLAFVLLAAGAGQTLGVRSKFSSHPGPGEEAVAMVESSRADPFEPFMVELVETTVVMPHLGTTYRKMGAGMNCSLRFYREGRMLCATDIVSSPGYSGHRLANVMRMLADVGILASDERGYLDGGSGVAA